MRAQPLCLTGPTRKCPTNHCHQFHRKNHENFVKLCSFENTTGLQSDPVGQVINLSTKWLKKETFKLLNNKLNFVSTQINFSKTTLNKELEDFYRRIKPILKIFHFSKPILKMLKTRIGLLKKTYSENQQTKPEFQTTVTTV